MTKVSEELISAARKDERTALLDHEAALICEEYGIRTARSIFCKTSDEATRRASEIGFPIVLKVVTPDILHKTEAGGVLTGLRNTKQVIEGLDKISQSVKVFNPSVKIAGFLVQEMIPKGIETIVGAIRDEQFGPVVLFGLGGVFVEIFKDVSFGLPPLSEEDTQEMIESIRAYPLIGGYRGQPTADHLALKHVISNVGQVMLDCRDIEQIDLNPVRVLQKDAIAVDCKFVLTKVGT